MAVFPMVRGGTGGGGDVKQEGFYFNGSAFTATGDGTAPTYTGSFATWTYTFANSYSKARISYVNQQGASWNSMTIVPPTGSVTWSVEKEKLAGNSTSGTMLWEGELTNISAGDTITAYFDSPYCAFLEIAGV